MKTRKSKIARLRLGVRIELNQRIENGEPAKDLVKWLNGLREVQEVLVKHFGGRLINEQNLSEWRSGGYLDWRAREEENERIKDMSENLLVLGDSPSGSLIDSLTNVLTIRYAEVLAQWKGEVAEEIDNKLRSLRRFRIELVALQETQLAGKRWKMKESKYENQLMKEERERGTNAMENKSLKEMMTHSMEQWNRDNPNKQKHYSFLKPEENNSEELLQEWLKRRAEPMAGLKREEEEGNIQQPTSNNQHPMGEEAEGNVPHPTTNAEHSTGEEKAEDPAAGEVEVTAGEKKKQNATVRRRLKSKEGEPRLEGGNASKSN